MQVGQIVSVWVSKTTVKQHSYGEIKVPRLQPQKQPGFFWVLLQNAQFSHNATPNNTIRNVDNQTDTVIQWEVNERIREF